MTTVNSINTGLPIQTEFGGSGVESPTAHSVLIGEGTSPFNSVVLTNGELLIGSTGADPVGAALTSSGSTLAYTTGAGTLSIDVNAPLTVPYGGTGAITLSANGVVIANGTSALSSTTLTNGQLLIGNTGFAPTATTLTQGAGITITNGGGSITIASSGGSFPIALADGGTGAALTANNGGIFYSNATTGAILAGTATAGQLLTSGASTTPAWTTSTYPATNAVNTLLYASSANTMAALATANSGVLITSSGGVPSIGTTLPSSVQGNITSTGTIASGVWNGTAVPIANGGTGSTSASAALTALGAVPLAGGTMTGALILSADPVTALGAATKEYVDAVAQGLDIKNSCYAATTVAGGDLGGTYLNGIAGVGATLTNIGTLVAFAVDGTTPALNARILVKNQTNNYQNGIYTLTVVGSGAAAWVLTRSTDYNTPAEIAPGDLVPVDNGTVNAVSSWLQTATVAAIGTGNPITFSQFTSSPSNYLQVANNLSDVASASTSRTNLGLAIGTNVEAWSAVLDTVTAGTYTGSTSITTLGTVATGTYSGIMKDYVETNTAASSSTSYAINMASGNVFTITLTGNCTLTMSGVPASNCASLTIVLIQGSGPYTVTWPSSFIWPGGTAPTLTTTNGHVDVFVAITTNGGTTFRAFTSGQNFAS